jgi:hypothetical protein
MLPVIVPPIRKGICRFIIDYKIVSIQTTTIYIQHPILVVVAIVFHSFPYFF